VSEAALKALGEAIRTRRGEIDGLSQEGLADLAGMHRTYVSEIERGLRNPSFRNLFKLATALEVPLSELVAQAERKAGGDSVASESS
jgi:transcriptional regulator with XRE-family HTH domain